MDPLNIVVWGVIGLVASLIVILLTRRESTSGIVLDVILGVIAGIVGGFILRVFNVIQDVDLTGAVHLPSALIALIAALIVVGVVEFLRRAPE